MKNLIFVFVCLLAFNVVAQTVYIEDQITFNDDSNLVLNKSDNTPISGVVETYSVSGQLWKKISYKDGRMEGPAREYYEHGQLYYEVNYQDGKPEGLEKIYHINGQLASQIDYKDGHKLSCNCWDESGNKFPCP